MHRKTRRKRANLKRNSRHSLSYLGYEAPAIYDSFERLDAKLTGKKKKRKRELTDKRSMAVATAATAENDGMTLDSLPIKGKNRLDDEVILLNKREAWKRENEKQLEEVAFGKDMRNSTRQERERFERLTAGYNKRGRIDEASFRMKRENVIRDEAPSSLVDRSVDRSNDSRVASDIGVNGETGRNSTSETKENEAASSEDRLRLAERRINVFVDNNKTDAAIDLAKVDTGGNHLTMNATADNQIEGKLRVVNRETKIDGATGSASFANLTRSDVAEPRLPKERRKVAADAERETEKVAVKLKQAPDHRNAETVSRTELKNQRKRNRDREIYGIADWRTDLFYDDENLPRNKLRGKYVGNLDEPDDLDTAAENNLVFLRLRSKKWPNDVVEWKLVPVIRRSPYRDAGVSPRTYLTKKRIAALSNDRNVKVNPYSDRPRLWRLRRRGRRNGAFNDISPVFRVINDGDGFSLDISPKPRTAIEIARFNDLRRVVPRTLFKRSRKLPRPRNGARAAGFRVPWSDLNRELGNLPRSRDDPELDDQTIYDDGIGLRLPISPYRYYVDLAHSPTTAFHFVPDILERTDDNTYRYPVRAYLEYGSFDELARDSGRGERVARPGESHLGRNPQEAANFSPANSSNSSPRHGSVREKLADESARGDHPASAASPHNPPPGKIRENNETRTRLGE